MASSAELFSQANEAFVSEDYAGAIDLYTRAIELDSNKAQFFSSRSHAFQKLEKYEESKSDAQKAIELNPCDQKAHLRKGIACFHLEQFEEAKNAFMENSKIEGNEKNVDIQKWISRTEEKLEKQKKTVTNESLINPAPESKPASSVKYDWYQTESHVCVTVLAKNLNPEFVTVDFTTTTMLMNAKLPDGTDYVLKLNLLFPIIADQCSFAVMKTKVEIKMKKCDGIRWTALEGQAPTYVKHIPIVTDSAAQPPAYPSSAPKKKDWDKIESEITKEEAEEKPEGEAALNQLFQKIYCEGSDEIRRAMNKSFQESGGTVLSTNWSEVAKEKVTVKPPDGLEFKKWDE